MSRPSFPLIFISYFAFIIIGMTSGILNIAWIHIQATFDVSLDSLGVLLSVGMIGGISSSFLSGKLIGRMGIGAFLLCGSLIASLGLLSYIFAPAWVILLTAPFFSMMGGTMIDSGMNTFVSARYGPREMNWLHAFWGIGHTIGPLFITFLITDYGQSWRAAYILVITLQVVFASSLLFTFKHWGLTKPKTDGVATKAKHHRTAGLIESLRVPAVLISIGLFFLYGGVEIGAGQLSNNLFVEGRGIDPRTAGLWISVYWASFTIGRILMGILSDYVSTTLLMRGSVLGGLLGAFLLWINVTPIFGFLGLAILGFSLAPLFPVSISLTPGRVGEEHAPNTIGFSIAFATLGGALLPSIGAAVAARFGLESIGLLIVINAALVLVLYMVLSAHDSHREQLVVAGTD